jgi:hypothetical protein
MGLATAVILGSQSVETRDHILLSQIPDFPFRRLVRVAGLRWRYSTPPPHGIQSQSYVTTDGQSASLSWFQAPIWGLLPDLCYCLTFEVFLMWGALSDERMGLPNCCWSSPAQSFLGPSATELVTIFFCLRFETPSTWRARSPYLYSPESGCPSHTSRHWVPPPTRHYSINFVI